VGFNQTLAPQGPHDASLFCQHFSYNLPGGRDWRQEKQRAVDLIFDTVNDYAPNFRASIVGHCALARLDLEDKALPSRPRYFPRRIRSGSALGRAPDVRLR
jgi:phytoene dehydrogenase-like protein